MEEPAAKKACVERVIESTRPKEVDGELDEGIGSEAATEREKALLADLIIARDALEKMKGVLSQRLRYEAQQHSSQSSRGAGGSGDDSRQLVRDNKKLSHGLRQARNKLEQRDAMLERLQGLLVAEGLDADVAKRIAGQMRAPLDVRLTIVNAPAEVVEVGVKKGAALRPAITLRVDGSDAATTKELIVRVRAVQGSHRVDGALSGETSVALDVTTGLVTFSSLCFTKTSQQCNGLPVSLVFELLHHGVSMDPSVIVRDPRDYHVTARGTGAKK
jgi:hypothetical protein